MVLTYAACLGVAIVLISHQLDPFGLPLIAAGGLAILLAWVGVMPWLEGHCYLFHPLYLVLLTFGLGYLARSLYIMFGHFEVMVGFSELEGPRYLGQALALAALGTVSLLLGYRLSMGRRLAARLPVFGPKPDGHRLMFVIALYLVVGFVAYALFIRSVGGISFSLDELTTKRRSDLEFLRVGSRLVYLAVFLGFVYIGRAQRDRGVWLLLWLPLLAFALWIPLTSSSRLELLEITLVLLILFHHLVQRIKVLHGVLFALSLLAVSLVILSQRNKGVFSPEYLREFFTPEVVLEVTLGRRDFADITTMAHIVRWVDTTGKLVTGEMFVNLITRFVPRAIWPAKPVNIGNKVSELFYNVALGRTGTSVGVPPSLIAELLWNFHLPGVAVGMLAFGVFIRTIYEYLRRAPANPWTVLLFGVSATYVFSQSKGEFVSATFRYLMFLAPVVAAAIVAGRGKPHTEARA